MTDSSFRYFALNWLRVASHASVGEMESDDNRLKIIQESYEYAAASK